MSEGLNSHPEPSQDNLLNGSENGHKNHHNNGNGNGKSATVTTESPLKRSLAEMAALAGFSISAQSDVPSKPSATPFYLEPESGTETELEEDPDSVQTVRAIASQPLVKMGFVGGVSLLAFAIVGGILHSMMNPSRQTSQVAQTPAPVSTTTAESSDPFNTEDSGETGKLKTELALQQQQAELKRLSQAQNQPKPNVPTPKPATVTPAPQPVAPPRPSPPPAVVQPRPVQAPLPPPSVAAAPPKPQIPPEQQWQLISATGSFGFVPTSATSASSSVPSFSPQFAQSAPTTLPGVQPRQYGVGGTRPPALTPSMLATTATPSAVVPPSVTPPAPIPTAPANGNPAPVATLVNSTSTSPPLTQAFTRNTPHANVPGMRPPQSRAVLVGTTAKATLTTPIAWAGENPGEMRYIVTLEEDIQSTSGEVILPQGAQLVVVAASVNAQTGIANLRAVEIILADRTYQVPSNSITLRGEDGEPIIAEALDDPGDEIAGMDLGIAVMGALENVGSILNRPQRESLRSSNSSTSEVLENGEPNILGAVLEGSMETLTERISERNETAIEQLSEQPIVWHLPAGTELQVFVNQTLNL